MRIIDYKKAKNEALKAMVEFEKMGDKKMANNYLNLAAHIQSIRTSVHSKCLPKDTTII